MIKFYLFFSKRYCRLLHGIMNYLCYLILPTLVAYIARSGQFMLHRSAKKTKSKRCQSLIHGIRQFDWRFSKAVNVAISSGDLVTGIAIDAGDLLNDTKLATGSGDLGPACMLFT